MKNLILVLFLLLVSLQSCQLFSSLTSTTYIDPKKSFLLGEGKHGSYTAQIKNVGNTGVEVLAETLSGVKTALGTLKPGQKGNYAVEQNTKVFFKNTGTSQATIAILLSGDTGLSMGYKDNQ